MYGLVRQRLYAVVTGGQRIQGGKPGDDDSEMDVDKLSEGESDDDDEEDGERFGESEFESARDEVEGVRLCHMLVSPW
jgi:hypothetical protein